MTKLKQERNYVSPNLSFVGYLEKNLREAPPRQKGQRTRERIKIATAKALEKRGYHDMRVVDITETAGLAEGSFYIYFTDKKHASLAVVSSFLLEYIDLYAPPEDVRSPFDSICMANKRWFALCRANAGLIRCVFQLSDENTEFAQLFHRTMHHVYLRISRNVRLDHQETDRKAVLLGIYFMGSMMDDLVRKLIIFPDKEFHKILRSLAADDAAIAEAASLVWARIFDPTSKPPKSLSVAATQLARMMWPKSPIRGS